MNVRALLDAVKRDETEGFRLITRELGAALAGDTPTAHTLTALHDGLSDLPRLTPDGAIRRHVLLAQLSAALVHLGASDDDAAEETIVFSSPTMTGGVRIGTTSPPQRKESAKAKVSKLRSASRRSTKA